MSEEDDENIEKFFLSGTGRPDIRFNEDDWLALRTRLEAEAARSARIYRKRIAVLSLCFVVILSTFLVFWRNHKNVDDRPDRHSLAESRSTDKALNDSSANQKRNEAQETPLKMPKGKSRVTTSVTEFARKHLVNPGSTKAVTVSFINEMSIEKQRPQLSTLLEDKALPRHLLEGYEIKQANDLNIPYLKSNQSQIGQDSSVTMTDKNDKYLRPHFSLIFLAAPEFSFSKRVRVTSPGRDFGMVFFFHLNETISLSAGLIASKKKYVGSGSEYGIREAYWKANTNGIVPAKILGSCSIVEIPLMLQLRLLGTEKNYFFIASGTSSYLMLSESYNYEFEQPNPGAKDGWTSEKNSTFVFSTINLSMSYERNISNSITIGLEPYLKVPVKKIGWPNLELFSSGVNVVLRYKAFRK